MAVHRESNVSKSWGDSGWTQDGAAVFKKETDAADTATDDTATAEAETDNLEEADADAATKTT